MVNLSCLNCGGLGTLEFLCLDHSKTKIFWRKETCPTCKGSGRVEEETFQERKEREEERNGTT